MQSLPSYIGVRDDEHFHIDPTLAHHMHQSYSSAWTPIDPALCNVQFEPQKHSSHSFIQLQHSSVPYYPQIQRIHDPLASSRPLTAWGTPIDSFRMLRYDSPGGPFGGNMSESSSEYAVSPILTRPQITYNNGYFSPQSESQLSQQSWTASDSFLGTPASTPTMMTPIATQPSSIAMKELEFQGNPEFQLDLAEDDIRGQMPMNAPEELELSDRIAILTTPDQSKANLPTQSIYGTDSSVSSPVQDRDSDSDFDPKRRTSKPSAGTRTLPIRSPRRSSLSSYPTLDVNNRIHKPSISRSSTNKEKSKPKALPQVNQTQTNSTNKTPKSFPCTFHLFGCPSTFANKNEWKRHVTSQHLQLGFYRCDLGTCNPDNNVPNIKSSPTRNNQPGRGRGRSKRRSLSSCSTTLTSQQSDIYETRTYNDFNRKDLFTQHCRRMHGPARHLVDSTTQTNQDLNTRLRAQGKKLSSPANGSAGRPMNTKEDDSAFEEELESIRVRCWTQRRYAPTRSSCGFCGKLFEAGCFAGGIPEDEGENENGKAEERAWEERMEHLGRHYERDSCAPAMEGADPDLRDWGLHEGILYLTEEGTAWLEGYEFLEVKTESTHQRRQTDQDDGSSTTRRRGPRRKASIRVELVRSCLQEEDEDVNEDGYVKVESTVEVRAEDDDSDQDAMAEDD